MHLFISLALLTSNRLAQTFNSSFCIRSPAPHTRRKTCSPEPPPQSRLAPRSLPFFRTTSLPPSVKKTEVSALGRSSGVVVVSSSSFFLQSAPSPLRALISPPTPLACVFFFFLDGPSKSEPRKVLCLLIHIFTRHVKNKKKCSQPAVRVSCPEPRFPRSGLVPPTRK